MGYPRDLDELTDREIVAEYRRRIELGSAGSCTYCEQRQSTCNCRMRGKRGQFRQVFSGAGTHTFNYHV